jgi:hypothetical protein
VDAAGLWSGTLGAFGPATGGTRLRIVVENFGVNVTRTACRARFGDVSATVIDCHAARIVGRESGPNQPLFMATYVVESPAATESDLGPVPVTLFVSTSSSVMSTTAMSFRYVEARAPAVSSLSSSRGPVTGGHPILVTLSNFPVVSAPGDVVISSAGRNASLLSGVSVVSSTATETTVLIASMPTAPAGTNRSSTDTLSVRHVPTSTVVPFTFNYVFNVTFVATIFPATGSIAGGEAVVIDIWNVPLLVTIRAVSFGGHDATCDRGSLIDSTTTRLACTTPPLTGVLGTSVPVEIVLSTGATVSGATFHIVGGSSARLSTFVVAETKNDESNSLVTFGPSRDATSAEKAPTPVKNGGTIRVVFEASQLSRRVTSTSAFDVLFAYTNGGGIFNASDKVLISSTPTSLRASVGLDLLRWSTPDLLDARLLIDGQVVARRTRVIRVVRSSVSLVSSVVPSRGPLRGGKTVTVTVSSNSAASWTGAVIADRSTPPNTVTTTGVLSSKISPVNPWYSEVVFALPALPGGRAAGTYIGYLTGSNNLESSPFEVEYVVDPLRPVLVRASVSQGPYVGGTRVTVDLRDFPIIQDGTNGIAQASHVGICVGTGSEKDCSSVTASSVVSSSSITTVSFLTRAHRPGFTEIEFSTPLYAGATGTCRMIFYFTDGRVARVISANPIYGHTQGGYTVTAIIEGLITSWTGYNASAPLPVFVQMAGFQIQGAVARPGPVNNDTSLATVTFTAPFLPAGTHAVMINDMGLSREGFFNMYLTAPPSGAATLTSLRPSTANLVGGTIVSLTLANTRVPVNESLLRVSFNVSTNITGNASLTGRIVPGSMVTSDRSITFQMIAPSLPSNRVGLGDVAATMTVWRSSGGSSAQEQVDRQLGATAPFVFEDRSFARIVSVSPSSGSSAGGTLVAVRVRDFTRVTNFNDVQVISVATGARGPATSVLGFDSATRITTILLRTLPSPGTATWSMQLSPLGMTGAAAAPTFQFAVSNVGDIRGIAPLSGSADGGDLVTITVRGVSAAMAAASGASVTFAGRPATVRSVMSTQDRLENGISAATIVCVSPAAASAGTATVVVSIAGTTRQATFEYVAPMAPVILSMVPSSGSVVGGTVVTIVASSLGAFDGASLFVTFRGVSAQSSVLSSNVTTHRIRVIVPPHSDVGDVAVLVSASTSALTHTTTRVAVGTFRYEWTDPALSMMVSAGPLPSHGPGTGGTLASLTLLNAPMATLKDMHVTLAGRMCETVRYEVVSETESTLAFITPWLDSVPTPSKVHGRVTALATGSVRYTADFEFTVTSDADGAYSVSVYPSRGSAVGGVQLRVTLSNFSIVTDVRHLQVSFGGVPGTVDQIITSTTSSTELFLTTPQFSCLNLGRPTDSCTVQASISPVWDPSRTRAANFPFEFTSGAVSVFRLSPSALVEGSATQVTVAIRNFPVVSRLEEVEVSFGGLAPATYPRQVLFSDRSMTLMTFVAPPALPSTATFAVVPVFNAARSVVLPFTYEGALDTKLVSFSPSMGPASGYFSIDVIIDKFPIRPIGSYDANYVDVSGPQDAGITINSCTTCARVVGSSIVRGGLTTANSTSQITFNVTTSLTPGRHTIQVHRGIFPYTALVVFSIMIYDDSVPTVISVSPSSGPRTSSNMVSVQVGSFQVSLQPGAVIATVGGARATVVNMATSGFVTSVLLRLPAAPAAGIATITLSSVASVSQQASLQFLYQNPCDYDTFCPSALFGSVKDTARILSTEPTVACDASMCILPGTVAPPVVTFVSTNRGPATGNTLVTFIMRGFPTQTAADILVRFNTDMAEIQSYATLSGGSTQLIVRTPAGVPGPAQVSVTSQLGDVTPAVFGFTYYANYLPSEVTRAEVHPSRCNAGEVVPAIITLPVWNSVPLDSTVHTVMGEGAVPWMMPTPAFVLYSEPGGETRLNFTLNCTGMGGALIVSRSDFVGTDAQTAVTTTSIVVAARQPRIDSVYPPSGPKTGFKASAYLVNILPQQVAMAINPSNASHFNGNFNIESTTPHADGSMFVFTVPTCLVDGEVAVVVDVSGVNVPMRFRCEEPSTLAVPVVSFVSQATSSVLGGTSVNVWVDGLAPLDDPSDLRSIVVLFETEEATVTRIRSSTRDRTVVDFLTPAWPQISNVSVSIYRRKEAPRDDNTGKYMHSYEAASAVLDVSQGATSGGLVVHATIFGFRQLEAQAFTSIVARFGSVEGKVLAIESSIVGRSVIVVQTPAVRAAGVVALTITSQLFEGVSSTLFRYYMPAAVSSVLPSFGSVAGGSLVTVQISGMSPVTSASQLDVRFGQVNGTVTRLLTSTLQSTVVEVMVPDHRHVGPGIVTAAIIPSYLSSLPEQQHRSVSFQYMYMPQPPAVVSVSPAEAPAAATTTIHLSLTGFRPISNAANVLVAFGSISIPASSVSFSDPEGSRVSVLVPAGLLHPGVHVGTVNVGTEIATFRYTALADLITVGSVTGNEGPAEGGSLVTITLLGSPAIRSIAAATITFGSTPARVVRVINTVTTVVGRIATTILEVESPPLNAVVPFNSNGTAVVHLRGRLQLGDSVAAHEFATPFTYLAPLSVTSATLNSVGTRLIVAFNQPTNADVLFTSSLCDEGLFHPGTLEHFGAMSTCTWNGPAELQVAFGAGKDIAPGFIGIMGTDVRPANALAKRGDMAFTVLNSPTRRSPSGLLVAPSVIGPCENLALSCTVQVPEATIFRWRCAGHLRGRDDVCSQLSRRLMRERGAQVVLSRQDLSMITEPLATYTIAVQVEDESGARSIMEHSFSRSNFAVPSVTVYGAGVSYAADDHVLLQASSLPSTCPISPYGAPCFPGDLSTAIRTCTRCSDSLRAVPGYKNECPFGTYIMYRWFPVDASGHVSNVAVSESSELLLMPPHRVRNDVAYSYVLAVYAGNDGASIAEVPVRFFVHAPPVRAIIRGSDRTVSVSAGAVLDASLSGDGIANTTLSFTWACSYVSSSMNGDAVRGMPCRSASGALLLPATRLALASAANITIPANTMVAGDVYEFAVTVRVVGSTQDKRSGTASVRLYATDAPASTVSTSIVRTLANRATPPLPVMTRSEVLMLQSEPLAASSLEWGVSGSALQMYASDQSSFPLGFISPRFKMSADRLTEGMPYTFTLRNDQGVPQAWYTVHVATSPAGGSCSLSPTVGVALTTDFTVSCRGFDDEDGGVMYSFGLILTDGIAPSSWASPSPSATFKLPPGDDVAIMVTIRDAAGAETVMHTNAATVSVPSVPNVDAIRTMVRGILSLGIRSGDDMLMQANLLSAVMALQSFSGQLESVREVLAAALDAVVQRSAVTPSMAKRMVLLAASIAQKRSEMTVQSVEDLARAMDRISSPQATGLGATSLTTREAAYVVGAIDVMVATIKDFRQSGISISLEQEMIIGRALDSTISAVAKAALRDVALGEEEQLVRVQLFLFIAK